MEQDYFTPVYVIEIEGKSLSKDITQEITSLSFTDNEKELDVLELDITNRNLQFSDDPLFQEGNEIHFRFGYADQLSPLKKALVKEIEYDFPESGEPTIRLKAFDKGCKLAGKKNQKVWQKPAPGILYSEIAEEIAKKAGLNTIITPTVGRHLRVVQGGVSDAKFLQDLAAKSRDRDGDGTGGYVFFVQDDELHFHPRSLKDAPSIKLTYSTDKNGILRSFSPRTQAQGAKGAGVETKSVGVDPRKKKAEVHKANNETTGERVALGEKTFLINGNTGEGKFQGQETGKILPNYESSSSRHEKPTQATGKAAAESAFKDGELNQVEATAVIIGQPQLKAKQNIEIAGVGLKFSGVWYCESVRHTLNSSGYGCELKLKRNAVGKAAGEKSGKSKGVTNKKEAPAKGATEAPPAMVRFDANTGKRL